MPHLSRRSLPEELISELSERIVTVALLIRNREEFRLFFDDLLTRTEKIMLGKRLLIALLLRHNRSYAEISGILRVGETTIASVSDRLQRGGKGYRLALERLERKEKIDNLLDKLFKSIPSLPPRAGPGRWRFLRGQ